MLLTEFILPALALTSIAEAQGIHFGQVLKKKPGLAKATNTKHAVVKTSSIASSITSHLKAIKPTATPTAKAGTSGSRPKVQAVDLSCTNQTVRYTYVPSPNNPTGFIVDSSLAAMAKAKSVYPAGYTNVFANQYGALFASNYLNAIDLNTYDPAACAAFCDATTGCQSFNIYFERDPTLWPAAACANPTSYTGIRCAAWGSTISAAQAQNVGQWRQDFMVVIQGSNGYSKLAVPTAATGFTAIPLAGAVDTSAVTTNNPFLVSQFYTSATGIQSCASLCTNTTATNKAAAIAAGKSTYTPCNYFNTIDLNLNGVSQGTYCQLYSQNVSSYAGLYSSTLNGVQYDLQKSTGYSLSVQDPGQVSSSSTTTATTVTATTTTSRTTTAVVTTTTTTTTTAAAPVVTAVAVAFTTVTSAWTGTATSTSTIIQGPSGTILVLTPGATVASTTAAAYTTISVNSGTASTIQTQTLAPTVAGGPSTVQIAYPTAVQTCSNYGVRYAAYGNVWAGPADSSANYTTYDPTSFKTLAPMYNGTTTYIAEFNPSGNNYLKVYDQYAWTNNLTLAHTFYIFTNQDGYYSFNMPQGDNIVLLWVGAKAITGWTRANSDLQQFYTASPTKVQATMTFYAKMGQYLPIRVHWGNRQGQGELDFNVYGPDGSTVMSSNVGAGTGQAGPNVVQYPCDPSLGSQYPAWGQET